MRQNRERHLAPHFTWADSRSASKYESRQGWSGTVPGRVGSSATQIAPKASVSASSFPCRMILPKAATSSRKAATIRQKSLSFLSAKVGKLSFRPTEPQNALRKAASTCARPKGIPSTCGFCFNTRVWEEAEAACAVLSYSLARPIRGGRLVATRWHQVLAEPAALALVV